MAWISTNSKAPATAGAATKKGHDMGDKAKRLDANTLQFVRVMPGPIEKVWDYLTDPKKRGEWFASGPLPAKVGERFEMRFKHSDLSPHTAAPPPQMEEMDRNG